MRIKVDFSGAIEKTFKLIAIGIFGFVVVDNHKYTKNALENCKKEIYQTDSCRYKRFDDSYKEINRYADYKAWGAERDKMLDSIKKIGSAQKAYFEGINNIK